MHLRNELYTSRGGGLTRPRLGAYGPTRACRLPPSPPRADARGYEPGATTCRLRRRGNKRGYDGGEPAGRGIERTRVSSITENMPCHWSWIETAATSRCANRSGESAAKRHRITPQLAGSPLRNASSPKSVSNVRISLCSAAACIRTWLSSEPGLATATQTTSWPPPRARRPQQPGCSRWRGIAWLRRREERHVRP